MAESQAPQPPTCTDAGDQPCGPGVSLPGPFWGLLGSHFHTPIEGAVQPEHLGDRLGRPVADGEPVYLDTYRHGHPRRRRPGDAGSWLPLVTASGKRVTLGPAPPPPAPWCTRVGDRVCLSREDEGAVRASAAAPAARAAWLAWAARESGVTATRALPLDGEGWLEVRAAVVAQLGDAAPDLGDTPAEQAAEVAREITTDAHGMRWTCADLLGRTLQAAGDPLRLDASTLPEGFPLSTAAPWLARALTAVRGRPVLVALPPAWPGYAVRYVERLWNTP